MKTKQFIVQRSQRQLAKMADDSQDNAPYRETLGLGFWRLASPIYPSRNRKLVRVRLDPEVLEWFGVHREDEHGGMNAVLRAYVEQRRVEES